MSETCFLDLGDGRTVAFRHHRGRGPTVVFLPGYMSDMAGSKAAAVMEWAKREGRACLLLDYSGCGESWGSFADGTLTRWRDEVLVLVERHCPGSLLLVGSSMGGWLMLMVALALPPQRVSGILGIAAAPDFTEWGYTPEDKAKLASGATIHEENPYGPEPTPTHPGFWADGQANRLLDRPIRLACPARLLHGQADPDVPWEIALRLAEALGSADVQVTLIKDGDHRLSRPADVALLLRTLAAHPALTPPENDP